MKVLNFIYAFQLVLHQKRLSTKSRLHHCNMQATRQCPICPEVEDCFHLFLACPRSLSFRNFIGLDVSALSQPFEVEQLWSEKPLRGQEHRTFMHSMERMEMQKYEGFRHEDETKSVISKRSNEDLIVWSNRCFSPSDKMKVDIWSNFFPT